MFCHIKSDYIQGFDADKLRKIAVGHASHIRDTYFGLIRSVFTEHYGFIEGTWDELNEPARFHNLQLMYKLAGSRDFGILNNISTVFFFFHLSTIFIPIYLQALNVIELFNSPGYQQALKLMLPAAKVLHTSDGLMPYGYYASVGVYVSLYPY